MKQIYIGENLVSPEANMIGRNGDTIKVTAREMEVLEYLIGNGTALVRREELLENIWKDVVVNNEAVTLIISRLRTALGDNSRHPKIIETIPKKGYRMMIESRDVAAVGAIVLKPAPLYKSGWLWASVLGFALVIMSLLFSIVRSEYEKNESRRGTTVQLSDG